MDVAAAINLQDLGFGIHASNRAAHMMFSKQTHQHVAHAVHICNAQLVALGSLQDNNKRRQLVVSAGKQELGEKLLGCCSRALLR
jgi:alpha-L-fucosidase